MERKLDDRGVPLDSPWYPHDVQCIRRAVGPRPQECNCGGNELMAELAKKKNT